MRAQFFHYKIIETKPLSDLAKFHDHPRLRVFFRKGCKCVACGIEATQLGLGLAPNNGGKHWDLYTDNFYPLTVDHIYPRSRGGSDALDNLQPMCYKCNQSKGAKVIGMLDENANNILGMLDSFCKWPRTPNRKKPEIRDVLEPQLGWTVYKRSEGYYKYLGIISLIGINPHTNRPAIQVEDKLGSWYHYNQLGRMKIAEIAQR